MAACLITVSGTSGDVRVDYEISSVPKHIVSGIGTFYIEDTATDVTYTTLSGDAIASSLCLTVTNLPYICFNLAWKGIRADGYQANAIVLGSSVIAISDTSFPDTSDQLIKNINGLHDSRVEVVKYKIIQGSSIYSSDPATSSYSYIVRVLGTETPYLRVRNEDSTGYIYIHGISSSCSPIGYDDAFPVCVSA